MNFRFDCDAPGERPNRLSAGQAVSTNFLSAASAFGAMSVATTCSPLARNSAVQLAPITPVPTMAMRRMGLVSVMSFLRCVLSDFGIGDAGEIALGVEEVALVLSIEIGGIDRTGEVGDEHPVAGNVEGDADSLHQVRDQDLRHRLFVDRRAIDGVAARRIAAVGPIEDAVRQIELEIDGFRQLSNSTSMSERFAGLSPLGISILARKRRPSPPLSGLFASSRFSRASDRW